ncbi:hypothetical protein A2291_04535 [candidate division WOR-1 bacterium RIFOXYB2_FULL_42_35]|uniref:Flagellar motor switch protein FliG C-terminal domain-containing protein n=1 Tax=candidate division WOR-1 bacterium RIFOXYC2_FULL_41_25 TaxID=1802586 RepID=A0A1F4TRF3_UNCSA|nr:MAG: hypothetical protein A2247_07650 [candidate division WOR-1 bacterium RIFOXYA2_FULL_41_14]OGC25831.1 MAG: hypothetical protein A2291_04535 [candidate division WOR-1 bacterium RIFOXYB2_FULL_42_35]OGC35271.1 MAG: hypothetical protein A2462_08525 [candidate division WOR-1 bacterium RIFOXYC2_FULL_41_25]OGC41645.1 MAG: hypothetical protein A2548_04770 [candidate division WOR-1 bacterium RIFOXYD2_FULL_41_8]
MSPTLVQGLLSGEISLEKAVARLARLPEDAIVDFVGQLSEQSQDLIEKKILVLVYREIAKTDVEKAVNMLRIAADRKVPPS